MNTWLGVLLLFCVSLFVYFYCIKNRMDIPKAGLVAIAVYVLIGLLLVTFGWNVSPWIILLPGLFVAALDILQLRQRS